MNEELKNEILNSDQVPVILQKLDQDLISSLKKEEIKSLVDKIQKFLESGEKVELPLNHYFSKDVYARELFIPKGTLLVGKIHKFQNMTILTKGKCTVLSIDGLVDVEAPCTFVSSPGVKRVIWAQEDSVWMTIHGTKETEIEKIENELVTNNYDEVIESNLVIDMEAKCLSHT